MNKMCGFTLNPGESFGFPPSASGTGTGADVSVGGPGDAMRRGGCRGKERKGKEKKRIGRAASSWSWSWSWSCRGRRKTGVVTGISSLRERVREREILLVLVPAKYSTFGAFATPNHTFFSLSILFPFCLSRYGTSGRYNKKIYI